MTVLCNTCYAPLTLSELAYYPLQWQHSGDMYCHKHETREQFKHPIRVKDGLDQALPYTCVDCQKPLRFPETFFYQGLTYCSEHLPEYSRESEGW